MQVNSDDRVVSFSCLFFFFFFRYGSDLLGSIGSQREVAMDSLQISLFSYLFCYRDTLFAS